MALTSKKHCVGLIQQILLLVFFVFHQIKRLWTHFQFFFLNSADFAPSRSLTDVTIKRSYHIVKAVPNLLKWMVGTVCIINQKWRLPLGMIAIYIDSYFCSAVLPPQCSPLRLHLMTNIRQLPTILHVNLKTDNFFLDGPDVPAKWTQVVFAINMERYHSQLSRATSTTLFNLSQ